MGKTVIEGNELNKQEALTKFNMIMDACVILYNRAKSKEDDEIKKLLMSGEIDKLEELRKYIKENLN